MSTTRPLPPERQPTPTMIDSAPELAARCAGWRQLEAVAVDTEFVRERTFYPALGLVQIADRKATWLVDVLAIDDLGPLASLLGDDAVTKVFHACGEDLETLHHHLGVLPAPVFDTQLAAALTGHGFGLGYSRLVDALLGFDLPKGETRSNWLRRPLSEAQKRYGGIDVAYLLPLYDQLDHALRDAGRRSWLDEEVEVLRDVGRFLPDPEEAALRIKGRGRLRPAQHAMLRRLASWREREARRRDLPRGFVLRDASLLAIARSQPRSPTALAEQGELRSNTVRRHGKALLDMLANPVEVEEIDRPAPRGIDLKPHRKAFDRLKACVAARAADAHVAPELLATRRRLEQVLRRHLEGEEEVLPRALRGWRREVLGDLRPCLPA